MSKSPAKQHQRLVVKRQAHAECSVLAPAPGRTLSAPASGQVAQPGGKQHKHKHQPLAADRGGQHRRPLQQVPPKLGSKQHGKRKRPREQQGPEQQPVGIGASAAAAAGDAEPAAPGATTPAPAAQHPPSKRQKRAQAIAKKTAALAAVPTTIALPTLTQPAVSSNWQAMKGVIKAQDESRRRKLPGAGGPVKKPGAIGSAAGVTTVLAIDCEMVGVGPNGDRSALARVCVVNNVGNVLLDTYVKPKEKVVDYRTKYSGIRPEHLVDAMSWEDAQQRVAELVQGKVLVGHAISNDLAVLLLSHPKKLIRDTSRYPPLMFSKRGKKRAQALRVLAERELGLKIQEGEHNPVDDARAALYLYHKHRKEWEAAIQSGSLKLLRPTSGALGIVRKASRRKIDYAKRDVKDDPLADL